MEAKIRFTGNARDGYTVKDETGVYMGYVIKSVDEWLASYYGYTLRETDTFTPMTFRTRKDAVAFLATIAGTERAARLHWANATSEDRTISAGDSAPYLASKADLIEGITQTYPDMDAEQVYYEWTEHGETIVQTVVAMRDEAKGLAAYQAEVAAEEAAYQAEQARLDAEAARIRTEWEAQEDAKSYDRIVVAQTQHNAWMSANTKTVVESRERQAGFLVTTEADGTTMVTVGIMSPDVPLAKSTGITGTGIPFSVVNMTYGNAGAAWRLVDVMAQELREHTKPFHVVIVGTRPDTAYEGTVYASQACMGPSYRVAGFPSLDAAIGAGYAKR